MKKITFLIACVLITSVTFAARREKSAESTGRAKMGMGVVQLKESLFRLFYKAEETSDVTVEVLNSESQVVFKEVIRSSDGFIRPYNLEQLDKGEYTIRVDNGTNWMSEKIQNGKAHDGPTARVISLEDSKFLLLMSGGDSNDKLSLNITGQGGEIFYEESEAISGNAARLFNMKDVQGPFTFSITGKDGYSTSITRSLR